VGPKDYLAIARRWWWLMVLLALLAGIAAFLLTPKLTPMYEATTTVLLSQASDTLPDANAVRTAQFVSGTYAELLRTRSILSQVATNLQIDADPDTLRGRVTVTSISNTNLLEVTVRDTNPQRAADTANEIVRVFILQYRSVQAERYAASRQKLEQDIEQVQIDLEQTRTSLDQLQLEISRLENSISAFAKQEAEAGLTPAQIAERGRLEGQVSEKVAKRSQLQTELDQYQSRYGTLLGSLEQMRLMEAQADFMSVIEEAVPGKLMATPPQRLRRTLQGITVGAALAYGIGLLLEYLRVTVKSSEEIERLTGLSTLGVIADIKGESPEDRLVTERHPRSPIAEAYRILRTNIDLSTEGNPIRTVVVTSAGPSEGKTTTAANLAIAVAQAGKRVILVDADLRRPALHRMFQQPNTKGVTTALQQDPGNMVNGHVVSTSVDNLYLMPSGPLPPNPADLLGSQRMLALVLELGQHADAVIIDSPPLLAVADATLLGRVCDAALLVVLAGSTRADVLKRAIEHSLQSGANLLGVVLNRVSISGDGYHYYQYYYSSSER
jgi:capsular exopolysaccharide synthesis family protein